LDAFSFDIFRHVVCPQQLAARPLFCLLRQFN
jgi:hypothetical protein